MKLSDFKRCECCNGKKTILALGGLIKKCRECSGVGHISTAVEKELTDEIIPVKTKIVVKKTVKRKAAGVLDKRKKAYRDSLAEKVDVNEVLSSSSSYNELDKIA